MSQQLNILKKFKTSLVTFLDELNEIIPDDGDLLALRIFVNDQMPILDLMENFMSSLYPHKKRAEARDDKFFLNKRDLFTSVKPETLEKFKEIWRSSYLDDHDRKMIWAWADRFYSIGDEYAREQADFLHGYSGRP